MTGLPSIPPWVEEFRVRCAARAAAAAAGDEAVLNADERAKEAAERASV
jgi:hypothetical protein